MTGKTSFVYIDPQITHLLLRHDNGLSCLVPGTGKASSTHPLPCCAAGRLEINHSR